MHWSLKEHAKPPNETNLDAHYALPPEGLWNAYLEALATNELDSESVLPKPSDPSDPASDPGPRTLIANAPASPSILPALLSLPTPPPTPSPHAKPASPAYLVPKLRWANIGWHYHWGNKQYDFSRGSGGGVADVYRRVCMRAVRGVRWDEVYRGLESQETGWETWKEEYGTDARYLSSPEVLTISTIEPDAGIVNFYQTKVRVLWNTSIGLLTHLPRIHSWHTSTAPSSVQLPHWSPFRASILQMHRSDPLNINIILDLVALRCSLLEALRATRNLYRYSCVLATYSSCPGLVVAPIMVSSPYT